MDSRRVEYLLGRIRQHFKLINKWDFTEADKAQLKTFYLEHFVAPDARKIMEKSLSEAFGKPVPSKPVQRTHTCSRLLIKTSCVEASYS